MKHYFKKTGIIVGSVLAAVLIILVSASFFGGGIHSLRDIFSPVDRLVNAGMDKLEQVYAYMYKYDELKAENEELKAQIDYMQDEVRRSISSNEENDRLRNLLKLYEENEDYALEDATLVSWTSSSWASSFTINKGTKSGIEAGDCVITENGFLIGQVTEAARDSALVQTILDPSSGVGAMVDRTGVTAVAEGDFTLMGAGEVKLSYISDSTGVIAGDTVMTSGKGGVYPSGLNIGTVNDLQEDASGAASYAVISPAADLSSLTDVFIIKDFDSED